MAISVDEIRNKEFQIMDKGGYNCDEVDDFLDAIVEQTEKLVRELMTMKAELKEANDELETMKAEAEARSATLPVVQQKQAPEFNEPSYFKNLETTLRETLISAQRIADETIDDARKKAAKIVSDAEEQAEETKAETEARLEAAKAEYDVLKSTSAEYKKNFMELIENQNRILNENPIFAE